jgi:probable phosphomutase (TIGR03848 family)
MTTVLLIRHGHTDTAGKRLTGWSRGVHLNERGRRQAESLVTRLEGVPLTAIYSSPLERCRETAAPLARARGLPVRVRKPLLEVDYGDWTGRSIASLRRTKLWRVVQQTPSSMRFPGGETLVGVQARVVEELDALAATHRAGTIAILTHADVVRLALMHYAAIHLDELQRLVVDPASVSVVALGGGVPRVVKVNDTGDLEGLVPAARTRPRPSVRG